MGRGGVDAPEDEQVGPVLQLAEGGRDRPDALEGPQAGRSGRLVACQDDRPDPIGQGDGCPLVVDRRPAEADDRRSANGGEDRGGAIESDPRVDGRSVDRRLRQVRSAVIGEEPGPTDVAGPAGLDEAAGIGDDLDVVAEAAAAEAGDVIGRLGRRRAPSVGVVSRRVGRARAGLAHDTSSSVGALGRRHLPSTWPAGSTHSARIQGAADTS